MTFGIFNYEKYTRSQVTLMSIDPSSHITSRAYLRCSDLGYRDPLKGVYLGMQMASFQKKLTDDKISSIRRILSKNGISNIEKELGLHSFTFFGKKVRWLNRLRVCSVCLGQIYYLGEKEDDDSLLASESARLMMSEDYRSTSTVDVNILRILSAENTSDDFWSFGIHRNCNPRSSDCKFRWMEIIKRTRARDYKASIDLANVLRQRMPSFKFLDEMLGVHHFSKDRVLANWAKRNPQKVSTEAARNFFKLTLGISNLEKFITTTQKQNKHHATNRK